MSALSGSAAYEILNDFTWVAASVAIVLTSGRLYLRWKSSALAWDDVFNGLALICLIGSVATPSPADTNTAAFWKTRAAAYTLTWTILWLVKASFLAFGWYIFKVSPSYRKAWLAISLYTFLAFWPSFLSVFWRCGTPISNYSDPTTCLDGVNNGYAHQYGVITTIINLTSHLSTEIMILGLPLAFIRRLQMSKIQKLSAGGVFSIAIFTIIVGFLRNLTLLFTYLEINVDSSRWITEVTSTVEPSIAVWIATLPPYKVLLSKFKKPKPEIHAAGFQEDTEGGNGAGPHRGPRRTAMRPLDSIEALAYGRVD